MPFEYYKLNNVQKNLKTLHDDPANAKWKCYQKRKKKKILVFHII